ncbi:MSEP-CTERM sorting domain-containing protein, partial [Christensenellaceae bacterium OttesenSCG-928-K19]|nr:MSEP-CTERM sorting domain-containing protein [Christensenellaceae bacterium OttesenSCG-928-K19]
VLSLALAVWACVYGVRRRTVHNTAPGVLGGMLALQAAAGILTITQLYQLALPAAMPGLEVVALLMGAVAALYLCIQLYLGREEMPSKKLWKQLALCILLPFGCAVAMGLSVEQAANTLLISLGVALLVAALIYFVLWLLTFLRAKQEGHQQADTDGQASETLKPSWFTRVSNNSVVVVIFAIILLQAGLMVNAGFEGMFGDYSSPWFFVLFLLNGIAMLPFWQQKYLSLPLLYVKSLGFSTVAYMAFVFIPFLPFGFVGIIFMGLGVLVFVPLFVCILEVKQLTDNAKGLRKRWSGAAIALVMTAGFATVPAVFVVNAYADKVNYENVQQYMDPAGSQQAGVNTERLAHTLDAMQTPYADLLQFDPFWGGNNNNTPLFSKLYSDIVLEGKALSANSIARMRSIFFDVQTQQSEGWGGTSIVDNDSFVEGDASVALESANTRTEYDEEAGAYKTWVDLEIKNSSAFDNTEYAVRFHLPDGCFIKDYYLYVGEEQKFGMLTDKRAALITYQSVVRRAQDPGVLYYADQDTIELRVFPFAAGETRKTGFYVMHSQQETLEIGGQRILLEAKRADAQPLDMGSVVFIPAGYKEQLEEAKREMEYYFVVDASYNSPVAEHIRKVQDYSAKNDIEEATVIFASYQTQQMKLSDLPDDVLPQPHFDMEIGAERIMAKGGFNLGAAMWQAQRGEMEKSDAFPVIVAVSDNIGSAVLPENMQEYAYFPESDYYYNLNYDATLTAYRFSDGERMGKPLEEPLVSEVRRYKDGYVSATEGSEILYRFVVQPEDIGFDGNEYENAFLLMQKSLLMQEDIGVVRDAFRQKQLTPATSFSVFETKEQEAELLALQEKILSGEGVDVEGDSPVVSMDEGLELIVAVFIAAALAFVLQRRRKAVKKTQKGG